MQTLETRYTRKFRELAEQVEENKAMALIVGAAGVGKTTAARMYASGDYKRCLVTGNNLMRSSDFITALLESMNEFCPWKKNERFEYAKERLSAWPRLIIVDEVNLLSEEVLEIIRSLHDGTGAPVILIGSKKFPARLRKYGLDQLSSRLQFQAHFAPLDLTEISLALPDLDSEAVKLLHTTSKGNLRVLNQLLRNMDILKEVNNLEGTTPELIRAAAEAIVII